MASSAGSITSKRDSLAPWPADKIKECSRTYNTHAKVHVKLTRGRCRRRCHGNSTTQQSTPTKYYTAELSACNASAVACNHLSHPCNTITHMRTPYKTQQSVTISLSLSLSLSLSYSLSFSACHQSVYVCLASGNTGNKLHPDIKTPHGLASQPLGCRAMRIVIQIPNRFLGDTVTEAHEMTDMLRRAFQLKSGRSEATHPVGRCPTRAFKSMQPGHSQTGTESVLPQMQRQCQNHKQEVIYASLYPL